jgi:hypothetical protein
MSRQRAEKLVRGHYAASREFVAAMLRPASREKESARLYSALLESEEGLVDALAGKATIKEETR